MSPKKFYLYKRPNGYWYIGYRQDSRRLWKSADTKNKNEALKVLRNFEEHMKKDVPRVTFDDFVKRFLLLQANNLRASTLTRIYLRAFQAFRSICGNEFLSSYTLRDIETFKSKRLESCSPTTVNMDFRTLRAAFNFGIKLELLSDNPFAKSGQIRVPSKPPVFISKNDFHRILTCTKEPFLRDLFLLAALTGMRRGEILNLRWENIDFQRKQIIISNSSNFVTKTGDGRAIPMNKLLFKMLSERSKQVNSSTYVFNRNGLKLLPGYVQGKFKKYVRSLNLNDDLHFHSLRHTFATWLVQGGVNIYEVQKLLGHSSVKVTEVYSHLVASELHESVNKISLT